MTLQLPSARFDQDQRNASSDVVTVDQDQWNASSAENHCDVVMVDQDQWTMTSCVQAAARGWQRSWWSRHG